MGNEPLETGVDYPTTPSKALHCAKGTVPPWDIPVDMLSAGAEFPSEATGEACLGAVVFNKSKALVKQEFTC